MAVAVGGRDALCRQFHVPSKSPMPTISGSSSSLLDCCPRKCWSTWNVLSSVSVRKRPTARGRESRVVRNCTPLSNSSDAEVPLLSSSTSRSPWDEALDSFAVDVVGAKVTPLNVALLAPFTIATTRLETVQNVAICVTLLDGSLGWGEAPTLPPVTAEDQPVALTKATQACSLLKSLPGRSLREVLQHISHILPGHDFASVRAGMEMALVDAVACSLKLPLWKFFGGHCSSITTDITIPICPAEEAEKLAVEYATRGFATIKTKVGGRALSLDIALLKAIRRGHPSCSLILDANCGYTSDEALQVLRDLHDLGLTPSLFEQPVMRDDWTGLGDVRRIARELYSVPVAADESCRSLGDAIHIVERGLAEVVNVKLAKTGVLEALELVAYVRKAGLELMIGGMVETRLAMGFAAHLVGGLGCFRFVDLDTPLLLADDPVHGGYKGTVGMDDQSFNSKFSPVLIALDEVGH